MAMKTMNDLTTRIGDLTLKNPVTTASGTFGDGVLMNQIYDVSQLGGIFAKAVTLEPRQGNPKPRMAETPSGMINAVGLQNKGLDYWINHIYPEANQLGTEIIPNVSGSTIGSYVQVAEALNDLDRVHAIELNISCPNVRDGGMLYGVSCEGTGEIVRTVRQVFDKTLIVKLTPNVTSIVDIAKAAVDAGADALSLINTLMAMAVDAERRRPKISTITGGLSGPAVKPIALRMVWQVSQAVDVPLIGIGGICDWRDAIEFILCGASAVQIGTQNFVDPLSPLKVIEGIDDYMTRHHFSSVSEMVGALITD